MNCLRRSSWRSMVSLLTARVSAKRFCRNFVQGFARSWIKTGDQWILLLCVQLYVNMDTAMTHWWSDITPRSRERNVDRFWSCFLFLYAIDQSLVECFITVHEREPWKGRERIRLKEIDACKTLRKWSIRHVINGFHLNVYLSLSSWINSRYWRSTSHRWKKMYFCFVLADMWQLRYLSWWSSEASSMLTMNIERR